MASVHGIINRWQVWHRNWRRQASFARMPSLPGGASRIIHPSHSNFWPSWTPPLGPETAVDAASLSLSSLIFFSLVSVTRGKKKEFSLLICAFGISLADTLVRTNRLAPSLICKDRAEILLNLEMSETWTQERGVSKAISARLMRPSWLPYGLCLLTGLQNRSSPRGPARPRQPSQPYPRFEMRIRLFPQACVVSTMCLCFEKFHQSREKTLCQSRPGGTIAPTGLGDGYIRE
jgi:hypothetical protein